MIGMSKFKSNILFILKSYGWTSLFVCLQTVFLLIALAVKVLTDLDIQEQLFSLIMMSSTTAEVDVSSYMDTYNFLMDVIMQLIVPTEILLTVSFISIYLLMNRKHKEYIRVTKLSIHDTIRLIAMAMILNTVISFILMLVPAEVIDSTGYSQAVDFDSLKAFWGILAIGICAPLCEEITFRYLCFNSRKTNAFWFYAIVPSLLFGLVHLNIIQSTYAFVLSMIFFIFNKKYNSITPGIILHLTINTSSTLLMYSGLDELTLLLSLTGLSVVIAILDYIILKNKSSMEETYQ